ncbi:MAG: hypothetical protein HY537_08640 [Deltaproteobacteria bacterium]|nr:hypothetical protein [Deltaproteobacteria bacterium]
MQKFINKDPGFIRQAVLKHSLRSNTPVFIAGHGSRIYELDKQNIPVNEQHVFPLRLEGKTRAHFVPYLIDKTKLGGWRITKSGYYGDEWGEDVENVKEDLLDSRKLLGEITIGFGNKVPQFYFSSCHSGCLTDKSEFCVGAACRAKEYGRIPIGQQVEEGATFLMDLLCSQERFNSADSNQDGRLNKRELVDHMCKLGGSFSDKILEITVTIPIDKDPSKNALYLTAEQVSNIENRKVFGSDTEYNAFVELLQKQHSGLKRTINETVENTAMLSAYDSKGRRHVRTLDLGSFSDFALSERFPGWQKQTQFRDRKTKEDFAVFRGELTNLRVRKIVIAYFKKILGLKYPDYYGDTDKGQRFPLNDF